MLVEKITEYLDSSWQPREFTGLWNATDCTGCPRALVLLARGESRSGRPKPWSIYKMQDGLLHEDDIKARLRLRGIKIQEPGAIIMPDAPIVCHPDGLVNLDGVDFGLEIKSYGCGYFHDLTLKGVKRQSLRYYRQMQLYMRVTGVRLWILLAKDRDCCEIYEEMVSYDESEAKSLIDSVLSAKAVLDQDLDPQALPCGNEFQEKLYCPFRDSYCHGPVKEMWDSEAVKAINDWLWAKEMESEANKIISSSHMRLRQIMADTNTDVMDLIGEMKDTKHKVRVYAKGQGRRVGDISIAEAILDPKVFNQIYQYRESEGPRIYRLR